MVCQRTRHMLTSSPMTYMMPFMFAWMGRRMDGFGGQRSRPGACITVLSHRSVCPWGLSHSHLTKDMKPRQEEMMESEKKNVFAAKAKKQVMVTLWNVKDWGNRLLGAKGRVISSFKNIKETQTHETVWGKESCLEFRLKTCKKTKFTLEIISV